MKRRRLSRKIALIAVVALLVTVLANAVVAALTARAELVDARHDQMTVLVDSLNAQIDTFVDQTRRAATAWREFSFAQEVVYNPQNAEAVAYANQELALLLSIYREFSTVHILNSRGIAIASGDASVVGTLDLSDRDYVRTALMGESNISEVGISRVTGQPFFAVAVPFVDDVSVVRGVMMVTTGLGAFSERVVADMRVGESGYAFLLNPAGLVIAHPRAEFIFEEDFSTTDFGQVMIANEHGTVEYSFEDVPKLAAFARNELTGWISAVTMDSAEIMSGVRMLLVRTVLVGLASAAFAIVILWFFIARSLSGVSHVAERMQEISVGQADLTNRIEIHSDDEIGALVDAFNRFVEGQRTLIANIKSAGAATVERRIEMESATEETASATAEISATSASVNKNTATMRDQISTAESRLAALTEGTATLDAQVQQQSGAVEQATASVEQMLASLRTVAQVVHDKHAAADKLYQNAGENEKTMTQTGSQIQEVVQLVGKIGQITKVIGQITAQTNMLAMNAAIEAAHAGDSGRGFAVVADEIRKLAEGSAKNSREINLILREVVAKIQATGHTTAGAVNAFNELYVEIRAVADAFEELSGTIQELSSGSDQILSAMHDLRGSSGTVLEAQTSMKSAVQQLGDSLASTADLIRQTAGAMNEIDSGTGEINQSMQHLRELVVEVAQSTDTLVEMVSAYRTE